MLMKQVLTGNRASLQFMQDEELHGMRYGSVPTLKPLNEKIKVATKKFAEDVQKRYKTSSLIGSSSLT